MSLCDTCIEPGACCRGLVLSTLFPYTLNVKDVAKQMVDEGTPQFKPIQRVTFNMKKDLSAPDTVRWMFTCMALDNETGRCTVYETRPQACRDYEAGSSPLCVHYTGWKSEGTPKNV